ncbi:bifunctional phosphoribosyl-AMP cyclohydrolase/phosphoribosyl-ATP diphosphatase HisIE [Desulforudis sp. DRI-14]|uniref:bifunctional phosphoribosyl-AMP cyclohydrolase/phosphoribosyl-ATP diphosphatase HisIE n=1 Tax=Desulforudis sp. DRI-14 TaxID=3459793 RepID=UPI0040432776
MEQVGFKIDKLKFNQDGLIPVIIQDVRTNKVLMLAYMNREALEKTMQSGETWFWSRSRQKLWHKGETSGHVQRVDEIFFDCDADTLLIKVEQHGACCHEGYSTCFHYKIAESGVAIVGEMAFDPSLVYSKDVQRDAAAADQPPARPQAAVRDEKSVDSVAILNELYDLIVSRKSQRPSGAYTSYLFDKGLDKILKKIGEETSEVIIGAKNHIREEVVYEVADLFYHVMVLLADQGIHLNEVMRELENRRK